MHKPGLFLLCLNYSRVSSPVRASPSRASATSGSTPDVVHRRLRATYRQSRFGDSGSCLCPCVRGSLYLSTDSCQRRSLSSLSVGPLNDPSEGVDVHVTVPPVPEYLCQRVVIYSGNPMEQAIPAHLPEVSPVSLRVPLGFGPSPRSGTPMLPDLDLWVRCIRYRECIRANNGGGAVCWRPCEEGGDQSVADAVEGVGCAWCPPG